MIPRLITALIFLFCGTMTVLLVRSVLYPRGTGLAKVSPRVAFDYFAARGEGSNLDVWEGNHITGVCQITPNGSVSQHPDGTASVKVNISVLVRLPQVLMNSETIKLTGDARLHSDGKLDALDLELFLPGSRPRVSLAINQPVGQASPILTLTRDREVLYSTDPDKSKDNGVMALMIGNMLKASGLSLEVLQAEPGAAAHPAEVRTGYFQAGGTGHDGYLLTSGDDESTRFDLYMSNTGEILRIDTPLTGDNELGLRFLAETLRPSGAKVPELDEYPLLRLLKKLPVP